PSWRLRTGTSPLERGRWRRRAGGRRRIRAKRRKNRARPRSIIRFRAGRWRPRTRHEPKTPQARARASRASHEGREPAAFATRIPGSALAVPGGRAARPVRGPAALRAAAASLRLRAAARLRAAPRRRGAGQAPRQPALHLALLRAVAGARSAAFLA